MGSENLLYLGEPKVYIVLALRQWCPLVSGWREIWTGWPWGVAGKLACLEREAEAGGPAGGRWLHAARTGWGWQDTAVTPTPFLALRLKHSGSTSPHSLVSLPWSFEVEMVWVQKQPCHSGSLPCTPHQGPQALTFRDRCLSLPALRACQSIRAGAVVTQPLQTQKTLGLPV